MNLNEEPTKQQLKQLLAMQDDTKGHHVVWVDKEGEVHITRLEGDQVPQNLERYVEETVKFRYESLSRNAGYVGIKASEDDSWVDELFNQLVSDWKNGREGYIDV